MNLVNLAEFELRLHHRHNDGSIGTFERESLHHDPAAHDPEREWGTGTIYRCTTCDEEILIGNVVDPEELRP